MYRQFLAGGERAFQRGAARASFVYLVPGKIANQYSRQLTVFASAESVKVMLRVQVPHLPL